MAEEIKKVVEEPKKPVATKVDLRKKAKDLASNIVKINLD